MPFYPVIPALIAAPDIVDYPGEYDGNLGLPRIDKDGWEKLCIFCLLS